MIYKKIYIALYILIALITFSLKANSQSTEILKQQLIQEIKLAKKYESYWAHVQHTPISHFLTNLTTLSITLNWNNEIQDKRDQLRTSIHESAIILGNLCTDADYTLVSKSKKQFLQERKRITYNKIPSHFSRKWPLYALTSISTGIMYYILTKKISITEIKQKLSLFYEKQIQEPVDNIKKHYDTITSTQKHIESNEKNYQDSVKNIVLEIRSHKQLSQLIEKDGINLEALANSNPIEQKSILDRINHLIIAEATSLKESTPALVTPTLLENFSDQDINSQKTIQNLKDKVTDIDKTITSIEQKIQPLEESITSAATSMGNFQKKTPPRSNAEPEIIDILTKKIVASSGAGEVIKQSSEALLLLKELLEHGNSVGKDAKVISSTLKEILETNQTHINHLLSTSSELSDDIRKTLNTLNKDYEKISPLINEISDDYQAARTTLIAYEPFIKIFVKLIDLDVQFYKILALRVNYQSQLPIILIGAIPAALVFYGAYKGIKKTYHTLTSMQSTEPLKHDLLQFQLHLNKHRYIKLSELSSFYHGMSCYWIAQLKEYCSSLSHIYKLSYMQYIDELNKDDLTPEQKIIIIECMFKEYAFLQ